jgi:hypothetical protein
MITARWCSIFFVGYLASSAIAQASTVGNGGDGVVCRDSTGTVQSIEQLDYFEGRVLRALYPDLGSPQLSVAEKVSMALGRLSNLDPERYFQYSTEFSNFFSNVQWVRGVNLVDIPDYGELPIDPTNCKIEQLAIQRKPEIPGDKRYVINGDLWDLMNNDTKAALVLHEVIYRDAITRGHTNSMRVRYFNTIISSHRLEGMNSDDYKQLLSTLGLDVYQWKDDKAGFTWQYLPDRVATGEEASAICKNLAEKYPGTTVDLAGLQRIVNSSQALRHSPLAEVIAPALWINLIDYPEVPTKVTFPRLDTYSGPANTLPFLCIIYRL